MQETAKAPRGPARAEPEGKDLAKKEAMVREMLGRVADKWTLLVIEALSSGAEMRFSRLRESVGAVSQKMLTQTLRQLERDGLVTRRVYPVVPPRVEYKLTGLGESLGESVCGIWLWVEAHLDDVERSRHAFDQDKAKASGRP
jgi:DNA-binding HxlR family transcriptional regulator